MKRLNFILMMFVSLFLFVACSSGNEIELENSSSENLENSMEEVIVEDESVKDETISEDESINSEDEQENYIISEMIEAINNSDVAKVSNNFEVLLNSDNRTELLEILNLEEKEVVKASNDFGIYGIVVYSSTSSHNLIFTQLSETEYVLIVDAEHRVYLDEETANKISEFFSNLGKESILNGNEKLISDVNNLVNELVVTDIESLYSVKSENLKPLSIEETDEIKNLLNINSWQLYTGTQNVYGSELKGGITFANLSQEYGGFEYYTTLNLIEVNGEYIARCYFFEGLGGQNNFSIPKEVYDNILIVSDRIKAQ